MAGEGRPPMSLLGTGCTDVDGRDKRGHDTWAHASVFFLLVLEDSPPRHGDTKSWHYSGCLCRIAESVVDNDLKASNLRLCLLLKFGRPRLEIQPLAWRL
jgi:hypothetical protein